MAKNARTDSGRTAAFDTAAILLGRWMFILFWVFVVTVMVAALTKLMPDRYEATAYLLINPSPYKTTSLEQPPFEVDVYERMLKSPPLVENVKERLGYEQYPVERLLAQMEVELIQRRSIRETTYAPMILLNVTGTDPERCRDIANTWAIIATSTSLEIKSEVIRRENERIRRQFVDTRQALQKIEDALTSFDITAKLEEKKAELETIRSLLKGEQQMLEELMVRYSSAKASLSELKRRYDSFFIDGAWVGALYGVENGTTERIDPDAVPPVARQLLLARNDVIEKSQRYANYKIREDVDILKRQYQILVDKIIRFEQDIEDMRLQLATEKAKLAALQGETGDVPERLTMAKAITDEALWQQYAGNIAVESLTSDVLVTEQVNPVWLTAQGRVQYLKPEIASLEARLESYESLIEQLRTEQQDLDSTVVMQTQNAKNLETEMQLAEQRYERLFDLFLETSRDIMYEEGRVAALEEQITDSRQQVTRLTSSSIALNEYTVTKTTERERLNRDLTSLKNIYTLLAQKYEEARIQELEVTGDLQVAFKAVLPQSTVGPSRILYVAAAFLASLIFFSLLVLAREYMRRQPVSA